MSTGPWIELRAPAKLNLFLEVLARRSDGYHELDTLMQMVDLCDVVRARRASGGRVRCALSGPFASADVPPDERNLAVRAAEAALSLARSAGRAGAADGLELELVKSIPSQSGLGGASSDAASAFAAVEALLGWSCEERAARAALAGLGADCVFFRAAASSGRARCRGRGELVEPLPAIGEPRGFLLVTPDARAATAAVYGALGDPLSWAQDLHSLKACFTSATSSAPPAWNRLEAAALRSVPELRGWRAALESATPAAAVAGPWQLTGSGSSFFAPLRSPAEGAELLTRVRESLRGSGLRPRGAWVVRSLALG